LNFPDKLAANSLDSLYVLKKEALFDKFSLLKELRTEIDSRLEKER